MALRRQLLTRLGVRRSCLALVLSPRSLIPRAGLWLLPSTAFLIMSGNPLTGRPRGRAQAEQAWAGRGQTGALAGIFSSCCDRPWSGAGAKSLRQARPSPASAEGWQRGPRSGREEQRERAREGKGLCFSRGCGAG